MKEPGFDEDVVMINGRRVRSPVGAATRLGCSLPTLRRLVGLGVLAQPMKLHGRAWYDEDQLERVGSLRKSTGKWELPCDEANPCGAHEGPHVCVVHARSVPLKHNG